MAPVIRQKGAIRSSGAGWGELLLLGPPCRRLRMPGRTQTSSASPLSEVFAYSPNFLKLLFVHGFMVVLQLRVVVCLVITLLTFKYWE